MSNILRCCHGNRLYSVTVTRLGANSIIGNVKYDTANQILQYRMCGRCYTTINFKALHAQSVIMRHCTQYGTLHCTPLCYLKILHSERHTIVLWLHYHHPQCILWSLVSDSYFSGSDSSLNVWLCLRLLMSW